MWKKRLGGGPVLGVAVCTTRDPQSSDLAEAVFKLRKFGNDGVKIASRDAYDDLLSEVVDQAGHRLMSMEARADTSDKRLKVSLARFMATQFPDVELIVGDSSIPANKASLASASPFFDAMLKEQMGMQEASTGKVTLPSSNPTTVRQLLFLLNADACPEAFDALNCTLAELVELLAQAAEWQCKSLTQELLNMICKANALDGKTLIRCFNVVCLHASSSADAMWAATKPQIVKLVATNVGGNLNLLEDLPFEGLKLVLQSNSLDVGEGEANVLLFVVSWVQRHNSEHLAELLQTVRFPYINLATLSPELRGALRFASVRAGTTLRMLLGQATSHQLGSPRAVSSQDEDGNLRARKRHKGQPMPTLNPEQLGNLLCGNFMEDHD